jgi:hypothetical protein
MNLFNPKCTITSRITAGLTRIERARDFLEAATLSEAWVREMGRRALILEAHHTTHIEGTRLTLEQAERLLEGAPVPEADPDDVRELLNYRNVLIKEHSLSDRQAKALGHILEHGSLTIQDFEHLFPVVNRRSLQRDLKAMIEKGVVIEKATSPTDPTKRYVLMEGTPG